MHILYIDEAGDGGTAPGSTQHLVLSGVAMHEAQWRQITGQVDQLQMTHFPQAGNTLELHASPLRGGHGDFRGIPKAKRKQVLNDMYRLISNSSRGLKLFAAVIHKNEFVKHYHGQVDPYGGAFEGLCTMFNFFLRRLQKRYDRAERGIVVFDESRPSLSKQLRLLQAKFQASGTRWTSIGQVIETPFFFDSRTSRLMQIADFCSHAVFRWYENNDDSYLKFIHHKFDHDGLKVHGLKCYPLISTKTYPHAAPAATQTTAVPAVVAAVGIPQDPPNSN
jgi:hypothetical protein